MKTKATIIFVLNRPLQKVLTILTKSHNLKIVYNIKPKNVTHDTDR